MNDNFFAYIFTYVGIAACCIGVPLLITFLGGAGIFAWIADNTLAVIGLGLIVIALIVCNRDRKKRRHLGARRERAVDTLVAPSASGQVTSNRQTVWD
ncbi:MAG: hypothetical protein V3R17_00420 [Hyphomicrobium sp.]